MCVIFVIILPLPICFEFIILLNASTGIIYENCFAAVQGGNVIASYPGGLA